MRVSNKLEVCIEFPLMETKQLWAQLWNLVMTPVCLRCTTRYVDLTWNMGQGYIFKPVLSYLHDSRYYVWIFQEKGRHSEMVKLIKQWGKSQHNEMTILNVCQLRQGSLTVHGNASLWMGFIFPFAHWHIQCIGFKFSGCPPGTTLVTDSHGSRTGVNRDSEREGRWFFWN